MPRSGRCATTPRWISPATGSEPWRAVHWSVLRSETAIERQLSYKDRNKVRAAYTHKAEFLEERRLHELVEPVPGGQPAGACHSA